MRRFALTLFLLLLCAITLQNVEAKTYGFIAIQFTGKSPEVLLKKTKQEETSFFRIVFHNPNSHAVENYPILVSNIPSRAIGKDLSCNVHGGEQVKICYATERGECLKHRPASSNYGIYVLLPRIEANGDLVVECRSGNGNTVDGYDMFPVYLDNDEVRAKSFWSSIWSRSDAPQFTSEGVAVFGDYASYGPVQYFRCNRLVHAPFEVHVIVRATFTSGDGDFFVSFGEGKLWWYDRDPQYATATVIFDPNSDAWISDAKDTDLVHGHGSYYISTSYIERVIQFYPMNVYLRDASGGTFDVRGPVDILGMGYVGIGADSESNDRKYYVKRLWGMPALLKRIIYRIDVP